MDIGTVKIWFADRGFGFIKPDFEGRDVFVHVAQCGGLKELPQGARVAYEIVMSPRSQKPQASKVRILEPVVFADVQDDDAVGNA